MDIERKIELVKRRPTCEVLTENELRELFEKNEHPKHYIGFEISGKVHLGIGLCTALKMADFIEAGIKPTIFLADYHAWLNGKMGGDLGLIQKVANGYFKGAFLSLGLDEQKVDYVLGSEVYDRDYLKEVLDISRNVTIKRMMRCTTIMGRKEEDAMYSSSILYPAMQAADIHMLDIDIAHAGIDQRRVHVLSREISEKMGWKKAVAVHSHLLMGLQGPRKMGFEEREDVDVEISSKMSKSKPETCIFIHDSEDEIRGKIGKAYCPEKTVENNPLIELCEHIIMRDDRTPLRVERENKYGGDVVFESVGGLKEEFKNGKLHPADLKKAVSSALSAMLLPSRKYFEEHKELLDWKEPA